MKEEIKLTTTTKRLFLTIILFLFISVIGRAQSFSVGHAIPLWGNTSQAVQVDVSFGFLTTTYIHIYKEKPVDNTGLDVNTDFLALFFTPKIDKELIPVIPEYLTIIPMIGVMNQPFPNENGKKFHFGISLSAEVVNNLDLYYKHISNGYFGETNLGIDTVGIKVKF